MMNRPIGKKQMKVSSVWEEDRFEFTDSLEKNEERVNRILSSPRLLHFFIRAMYLSVSLHSIIYLLVTINEAFTTS